MTDVEAPAHLRVHARVLPFVAGFLDAVGFLALVRVFTAHMTGTTVTLGIGLAQGNWKVLLTSGVAIPFFLGGVLFGLEIDRRAARSGVARPLVLQFGVEIVLLSAFTALGVTVFRDNPPPAASPGYLLLLFLATTAMGIQTASLRKVGMLSVHTTFVTGMMTKVVEVADKLVTQREQRRDRFVTILFLASVWVIYLGGAIAGAWLLDAVDLWCLALPVGVLIGLTAYELLRRSEVVPTANH
ncbi:MAG: YoaK family protein [Acidimicrobiia bacterium]